jgi:sugar lactone lactonase YvrE
MIQSVHLQLRRSVAPIALAMLASGCSLSGSGIDPSRSQSQLNSPSCCASTARHVNRTSGYLYVAKTVYSTSVNEIAVYGPNSAKPVQTITDGITGFSGTGGLAFDASGNLYVAGDSRSGPTTVTVYAPGKTSPSYVIRKGLDNPWAMAFDSAGNLYVLNCYNCYAYNHRRTSDHGFVSVYARGAMSPSYTITEGIANPIALGLDRFGNLYVANCPSPAAKLTCIGNYYREPAGGTVTVYPPRRKIPAYAITNGIDAPRTLAIDSSGNVYVSNMGDQEVAVYARGSTTPSYSIWLGVFDGVYPVSMAFDRKGNLYIANCGFGATSRVCVYAPGSASVMAYYQSPPNYVPEDLAFDHLGNLYVLYEGVATLKKAPSHADQVAINVYAPGATSPHRMISTGINFATAMAISP